ncbi:zinc-dependent alcohol dehydrogenase [Lactobacillus johnsonii]|uniref:zinc-dependent alcohol dehydrogenase n=1 Tax=Lactobacillus johnsonii TaxID=33959 RepID=UPI003DA505FF
MLIKNINASICGSDIAVYKHGTGTGHKISIGEKFGHEMVSEVAEVVLEVKDFKVGQRVYPYPVFAANSPQKAGTLGGFTECLLIKNAKLNHNLYLVPEEFSNEVAALTEPFTVATRAVKRAHPKAGENAYVLGARTIGLAAAFAIRHFGCKVMVADRSDYRLDLAKSFGCGVVNTLKDNVKQTQLDCFGKGYSLKENQPNINITIDVTGIPDFLQDFLDSQIIDSRFVMVGVDNNPKDIDLLGMIFASQSLIGSGGYRPSDVATVFYILKENQKDISKMVTKIYPWEELVSTIKNATDPEKVMNI